VTAAAESKDGASGGEVGGTGVKRRPSILGPRGGEEGTAAEATRATVGQGEGAAAGGPDCDFLCLCHYRVVDRCWLSFPAGSQEHRHLTFVELIPFDRLRSEG
jgi:hypothetical protein